MGIGAALERPFERRIVKWRGSDTSNEITLTPGAGWNLYVPSTFVGTAITVLVHVKRNIDPNDTVAGEEIIDDFKEYASGSITVTVDQVMDLTPNQLFGIERIKLKSNATETCTGEILMSS